VNSTEKEIPIRMKLAIRRRDLVTLIFTVLAAASGAGMGYVMGRAITVQVTEGRLDQGAMRLLAVDEARSREAREVLQAVIHAPFEHCSEAELGYFRDLMFQAQYLRDVGSIRDDKIDCSGNMGRLTQPLPLPKPDFTQQDDIQVFKNLAPPQLGNLERVGLRKGDAYVVLSGGLLEEARLSQMQYHTAENDLRNGTPGWQSGEVSTAHGMILTRNAKARTGSTLYATRCSALYPYCITTYVSIPEALQANRPEIAGFVALGTLLCVFFGLFVSVAYRRSRSLDRQLRRAIARDKLRLVYQPILHLASRRIVGAEALVRWTDEEGFEVGPDMLMKIAEDCGFVGEITSLVVRHVLRDFAETLRSHPDFHLSINVTAGDLSDPAFLPMLETSLKQATVSAGSLVIEITESSTARRDLVFETIARLRKWGYGVHIDDFGTGYSSLSYLHELSVDAIKIDKSFTQAIGTEAVTVSILPLILAMAEKLKLLVIVEGVETELQVDYFRAVSQSILVQGWYFGPPVPAGRFHGLLADQKKIEAVSVRHIG
jgi:sensor c-di-GMP phosphodiesterase-like protein